MTIPDLHPATRLCAWITVLIVVQCLDGVALAAAFALLPLTGRRILARAARLAWRARWLLVSLFVILSWGIAGEPLWSGGLSPTVEGGREAATHVARLLLVLFAVAGLLETMPLADLLAATHVVLRPSRRLGLDPDRAVVRLMLVLHYVETLPRPRDWRVLLEAPPAVRHQRVVVGDRPLVAVDRLAIAALLVTVSFVLLVGR